MPWGVVAGAAIGLAGSVYSSDQAEDSAAAAQDAANRAAERQAKLAEDQWNNYLVNFQPGALEDLQYARDRGRVVAGQADQLFSTQMDDAAFYRDRYRNTQMPLEDEIIANARKLGTQDEQNRLAGLAIADTRGAFADMRAQSERAAARQGLNPASAAARAMAEDAFQSEALASASAGTKARFGAMDRYRSGLTDAAALGRGLPGFSSSASGGALGSGGLQLTAAGTGLNAAGTASQISNQAAMTSGNLWGMSSTSALQGFNAYNSALNTQYNSPMMTTIGGISGGLTSYGMNNMRTNYGSSSAGVGVPTDQSGNGWY